MTIEAVNTSDDHLAALKEIESLMAAEKDTPDGDRLEALAAIVEAYEAEHFPLVPTETSDR